MKSAIWTLDDLVEHCLSTQTLLDGGRWVPARPINCLSFTSRLKAAWSVFTGKADAVFWPCGQ